MKMNLLSQTRALLLALAAVMALALAGCGSDETEFTQTLTFTAPISLGGKFGDLQPGDIAPEDMEVPIFIAAPFDLAMDSPELQERADGSLFIDLRLVSFEYEITENTLTGDLSGLELAIGPEGSEDPNAPETVLFGVIEEIKAGQKTSGAGTVLPENAIALSQHFFKLKFSMMQGATFTVKAGEPIPGGRVTVKSTVQFVLTSEDP
jgi:hypothetical protein